MHGFIFAEVKKYVEQKLDKETWRAILRKADLDSKKYENFLEYPDEEVVRIVATASDMTGLSVTDILEDFGIFVGGDLLKIYRPLVDKEWRTLDFLANVENTVHEVVRSRNRQARPPALVCDRVSDDQVLIVYRSERKMCALAKGIARGVAQYYGDEVKIEEESCMLEGDRSCRIRVILQ